MVVRKYKDEDFEAVRLFLERIISESDSEMIRTEFDKIKTFRDYMILVSDEDGAITGVVTGQELQSYLREVGSSKLVRIGDYYLREVLAYGGRAYELVNELIKRSRHEHNYTKIFATSNAGNHELLEELGFEEIEEKTPVNMVMDLGEFAYCSER